MFFDAFSFSFSFFFFFHFDVSFTRGNRGLIPRDISLEKVFGSVARRGKRRRKKGWDIEEKGTLGVDRVDNVV